MTHDYLDLNDGQLFYRVSGKGEPLVLLHGNFNDHQIWNEQTGAFSACYKVIRYDLRGYGHSSKPNVSFSNVVDLKALVDSLKLHRVTLIGSSSGGGVAIDFALTYPDRVQTLVLVSPAVNGNPYPMNMMWQGIKNYLNVRLKGREAAVEAFIKNHFWQYYYPSTMKEAARNNVLQNVRNLNNFCRFSPNLSTSVTPHTIRRLQEINVPTLIIISDGDHPYNIKTAEKLHNNIKLSCKIVMKGCNHLPFTEEPQEFNQIVLDFLSQQNTTS
ncbi:alpha/beta fold hydrolase [Paenibacillus azoreducens]|uniref:alpha/beta fold hydrolase n=1 Tax=Paenibacillus azoreducens TaxID=116718 RepID=UPI0039F47781